MLPLLLVQLQYHLLHQLSSQHLDSLALELLLVPCMAATWQAKWGIGALFAAMQSAGMAGFHAAGYLLLGLAGGAAGGGVAGLTKWLLGQGDHCGLDAQ